MPVNIYPSRKLAEHDVASTIPKLLVSENLLVFVLVYHFLSHDFTPTVGLFASAFEVDLSHETDSVHSIVPSDPVT